jgi:hypothetical protein
MNNMITYNMDLTFRKLSHGFMQMVFIRRRNNHVHAKKESLLSAIERNFPKMKSHLREDFWRGLALRYY